MKRQTKAQLAEQERQGYIEKLRMKLHPSDIVYTKMTHVSRSGMFRVIDAFIIRNNEPKSIAYHIAHALGWKLSPKHDGIEVGGCGMDMGFRLVYSLSGALFPDGFDCIGVGCPANDHLNARDSNCAICGKDIVGAPKHFIEAKYKYAVCSEKCAKTSWHHNDGGYALLQKWL